VVVGSSCGALLLVSLAPQKKHCLHAWFSACMPGVLSLSACKHPGCAGLCTGCRGGRRYSKCRCYHSSSALLACPLLPPVPLAGIVVVYVTAPSAEVADSLASAEAAFCMSSCDSIHVLPACPLYSPLLPFAGILVVYVTARCGRGSGKRRGFHCMLTRLGSVLPACPVCVHSQASWLCM
jgi:hypothetical protein